MFTSMIALLIQLNAGASQYQDPTPVITVPTVIIVADKPTVPQYIAPNATPKASVWKCGPWREMNNGGLVKDCETH